MRKRKFRLLPILFVVLALGTFLFLLLRSGEKGAAVRFWEEKDLRVTGLQDMGIEELHGLLPIDHSALWWLMNRDLLQAQLVALPYVKDARVDRCSFFAWRCYEIRVRETNPEVLLPAPPDAWIADDEGEFLFRLSQLRGDAFGSGPLSLHEWLKRKAPGGLLRVEGVIAEGVSPDLVKARLSYLLRAVRRIEPVVGEMVKVAELRSGGEFAVRFVGKAFPVVFDKYEPSGDELRDMAQRLRRLLQELSSRTEEIAEIDLAFERQAVVRFREKSAEDGA